MNGFLCFSQVRKFLEVVMRSKVCRSRNRSMKPSRAHHRMRQVQMIPDLPLGTRADTTRCLVWKQILDPIDQVLLDVMLISGYGSRFAVCLLFCSLFVMCSCLFEGRQRSQSCERTENKEQIQAFLFKLTLRT